MDSFIIPSMFSFFPLGAYDGRNQTFEASCCFFFISLFYFHFTVKYISCCIILRLMRKTCQKSNALIIEETEKKHTSNERYNEEESV